MKKNILEQYEDMKREYQDTELRIIQIKEDLSRYTKDYQVHDSVKGGMGGTQNFGITGFPDPEYHHKKTLLMCREKRMITLKDKLENTLNDVEDYIDHVENSRKRLILRYKYIDGLSWKSIAKKLGAGNNADSIRMEVKRFFEKEGKKN